MYEPHTRWEVKANKLIQRCRTERRALDHVYLIRQRSLRLEPRKTVYLLTTLDPLQSLQPPSAT